MKSTSAALLLERKFVAEFVVEERLSRKVLAEKEKGVKTKLFTMSMLGDTKILAS